MMKNIAFGAVVFTLLVSAAISSAMAYQNQWFPPQRSGITEGAPCPGISRSGRSAHYVWMPGYVFRKESGGITGPAWTEEI